MSRKQADVQRTPHNHLYHIVTAHIAGTVSHSYRLGKILPGKFPDENHEPALQVGFSKCSSLRPAISTLVCTRM